MSSVHIMSPGSISSASLFYNCPAKNVSNRSLCASPIFFPEYDLSPWVGALLFLESFPLASAERRVWLPSFIFVPCLALIKELPT